MVIHFFDPSDLFLSVALLMSLCANYSMFFVPFPAALLQPKGFPMGIPLSEVFGKRSRGSTEGSQAGQAAQEFICTLLSGLWHMRRQANPEHNLHWSIIWLAEAPLPEGGWYCRYQAWHMNVQDCWMTYSEVPQSQCILPWTPLLERETPTCISPTLDAFTTPAASGTLQLAVIFVSLRYKIDICL